MALTEQRKAEIDAMLQGGTTSGLTPQRKAEIDALLTQTKSAQPEKKGFLETLASPFTKVAATGAGVFSSIGKLLGGDVQGASEAITKERDFGILGSSQALGQKSFDPNAGGLGGNFGQLAKETVGTGAELGSYLVPGTGALGKGVATGVGQVAKGGLLQGAKTLGGAAVQGAKMGALGGSLGASGATMAEGGSFADTAKSALGGAVAGGVLGGALPVAGKAIGGLVKGAGRIGGEVLGKSTGMGFATVKEIFENPNAIKFTRQASKDGALGLQRTVVEDIVNGVKKISQKRADDYVSEMRKLGLNKIDMTNQLDDARTTARDLLGEFRIKVSEGKKLNNLDFETLNSPINPEKGGGREVQKAFNTLMRWTDTSAEGLDRLKRQLYDFVKATERNNDGSNVITKDLWGSVVTKLRSDVPGYEDLTKNFQASRELEDQLSRAFAIGGKENEERVIKKFLTAFRQDNEFRREMLETVESAASEGGKLARPDISGKAAGILSAPTIPRGLVGTVIAGSSVTAAVVNPANIPFLLTYLAMTSPRLASEAVSILGRVKGKTIPEPVKQEIFNLIIQAERILTTEQGEQSQPQQLNRTTSPQAVSGSQQQTQQPILGQFSQNAGFQGSDLPSGSPFV